MHTCIFTGIIVVALGDSIFEALYVIYVLWMIVKRSKKDTDAEANIEDMLFCYG